MEVYKVLRAQKWISQLEPRNSTNKALMDFK